MSNDNINHNLIEQLTIRSDKFDDRVINLDKSAFTIGKSGRNDIALDDPAVSRQHVELNRSADGSWLVVDLGSANGTELDGTRLTPHQRTHWSAGLWLRIGPFYLRWKTVSSATAVQQTEIGGSTRPLGREANGEPAQAPASGHLIKLEVSPERVILEPGKRDSIQVKLTNLGSQVDHVMLLVEDVPLNWYTIKDGASIELMPSVHDRLPATRTIEFHPPKNSKSNAGIHRFKVVARSQMISGVEASEFAELTLNAFDDFAVNM
ncbi:MAG: FHA domain-containing protein, partial [Chloroflexota bacterium]